MAKMTIKIRFAELTGDDGEPQAPAEALVLEGYPTQGTTGSVSRVVREISPGDGSISWAWDQESPIFGPILRAAAFMMREEEIVRMALDGEGWKALIKVEAV